MRARAVLGAGSGQVHSSISEARDTSPFAWIEQGLRSAVGHPPKDDTALRVADLMPPRFAAYAKIFHPIYEDPTKVGSDETWDEIDRSKPPATETERILRAARFLRTGVGDAPPSGWRRVRWSELAARFGLRFGPALSEKDLDRSWPGGSWPARLVGPEEGSLTTSLLAAMVRAIREERESETCYFWWWIVACMNVLKPERNYLFQGRLDDLPAFLQRQGLPSPTYWWPASKTWCVATDWDLCFSLLGGPMDLVSGVLESPEVEGVPVSPEDPLLAYAKRK